MHMFSASSFVCYWTVFHDVHFSLNPFLLVITLMVNLSKWQNHIRVCFSDTLRSNYRAEVLRQYWNVLHIYLHLLAPFLYCFLISDLAGLGVGNQNMYEFLFKYFLMWQGSLLTKDSMIFLPPTHIHSQKNWYSGLNSYTQYSMSKFLILPGFLYLTFYTFSRARPTFLRQRFDMLMILS